jgi:hypothetical protein
MMSGSDSALPTLLGRVGIAVLERLDDGTFQLLTQPPDWFWLVFPQGPLTDDSLGARSPFLDEFLGTAGPFWSRGEDGRLRSERWAETGDDDTDHHLEASAFCLESRRLLVVEAADRGTRGIDQVLQKARESSLESEALAKRLRRLESNRGAVVFDMVDACSGVERFIDALNPGKLSPNELQYLEIGRRQVKRLKELIRELSEG